MVRKLKNFGHLLKAIVANILHLFPSRRMYVIGVTGTDGKTTTVSLIYHILRECGKKVAMISTLGARIDDSEYDIGFHVTTPSSFLLQKYIRKAANSGSRYLVLEVTSHAIDQHRIFGIKFDIGVLTNVSHEHLDYHKTYEKYVATKAKLLESAKVAIVNRDDKSYEIISNIKDQRSNTHIKDQKWITYGLNMDVNVNPYSFSFKTNLIGEFNKYNCLAAIAVCKELGIEDDQIRVALLTFSPPIGRGDIVFDEDFKVMIDFAHTPNSFAQILPEVRTLADGRLIHVFGAAGKRDAIKRPLMGEIAAKYADIIILTAEDPRSESVERIMEEIGKGISNFQPARPAGGFLISNEIQNDNFQFKNGKKYLFKIPDRKKAIEFAISIAKKGDLVLLTGKSHEKSMNYGHGEVAWDEYKVVKDALIKRSDLSRNNLV